MKRKNKSVNRWADHYTRQARKEKFPARSVYKLKEIQQKFRILKKGDRVLDLGCSPGSWLLYAADAVGRSGQVEGIDLKPVSIRLPANVRVHSGDISAPDDKLMAALGRDFNVVLSDMAPATTGIRATDAARSFELCSAALNLAESLLVPGGAFVCKIFQGDDFNRFLNSIKQRFAAHKIHKPQSSRKASKEIYIIATGKQ
jgi:23S rRNA (uridine2552-2'-O)-methyltransferase